MGFRILIYTLKTNPALGRRLLTVYQHRKRFEKSICVRRRVPDLRWVQSRQDLEAVRSLVIGTFSCTPSGLDKVVQDIPFRNLLDMLILRKCGSAKALTIKCPKSLTIRQKPRFHDLHHKVALVVHRTVRTIPAVADLEMLPRPGFSYGLLGVHEKMGVAILTRGRLIFSGEVLVRIPAAAAGHNSGHPSPQARFFDE